MMQNLDRTYTDPRLEAMVRKVNEDLDAVEPAALSGYFSSTLVDCIEDLVAESLSASVRRTGTGETMAVRQIW